MESLTWYNPTKILFGKDSIEKIGTEIKNAGLKKVLILFGSGSAKKTGVYDRVKKSLSDAGIADVEVWGVQPNPLVSKVREAIGIAKDAKNGVEGILAVGGGSVIDSGKAIAFGVKYSGDIWEIYDDPKKSPSKGLPLFSVLTLSATASEFNSGSVLSNPEKKKKVPMFFANPVASAIDPTVQFKLPWRQVMCGAVDSLSHLMEQYFSLPNETISTRQINLALQKSVIETAKKIKKNNEDYEARANFVWAVSLALNGLPTFGLSGDWNVHYIEHAISAYNDKIAHAEGLAVISLAYYPILFKKGITHGQFEEWALTVFDTKSVPDAINKLRDLYIELEAPLTLEDLKLNAKDIDAIADIESLNKESGIPVSKLWKLSKDEVKEVLKAALKK
ncbi:MAG: alcohol dehydrogenase [Streblomastix strix]|uniref:Alcohol dehydrogenase n=1 Tax=Streblomastix strix TaxID=222440 RepID=A0A5J4VE72_9EUKA|nr:MAG: alcohol dehydrogenase [Streblomastix strix]